MSVLRAGNTTLEDGKVRICVPIAYETENEILEESVRIGKSSVADIAEWRIDWYQDVFQPRKRNALAKKIRKNLQGKPLLVTFRSRREGGERDITPTAYQALLDEIIESNTSNIVEIKTGTIFRNYITGIDKSRVGYAGSKNAKFYYNTKYGSIMKNTNVGIYGLYESTIPNKEILEVATKEEVKIGSAKIATVLNKEEVKYYDIEINKIDETAKIKNISFKITDKELLDKTGGVVQGMSGSPIIQNNKIIGAVTHVIIDNPMSGYGLFITTMLEEGEK